MRGVKVRGIELRQPQRTETKIAQRALIAQLPVAEAGAESAVFRELVPDEGGQLLRLEQIAPVGEDPRGAEGS